MSSRGVPFSEFVHACRKILDVPFHVYVDEPDGTKLWLRHTIEEYVERVRVFTE
jgi:hypothetical protein